MDRIIPSESDRKFVTYVGMETDLIFNQGIELPGGFASFPLLEDPETRAVVLGYSIRQIELAEKFGFGAILETSTWLASRDRAPQGYSPKMLVDSNRDAVALLVEARKITGASDALISGNIGPRSDGYAPTEQMTPDEAEDYHTEQISVLADEPVDLISAFTLTYVAEAIGIVRAAEGVGVPIVISFTVETDGRLPTGQELNNAIDEVDAATNNAAAYFMVNCAHPEHFQEVLTGHPRLRGVVVNASRCSHAELDESDVLDDGNPTELGVQVANIVKNNPMVSVIGGCCGTDMRHVGSMLQEAKSL